MVADRTGAPGAGADAFALDDHGPGGRGDKYRRGCGRDPNRRGLHDAGRKAKKSAYAKDGDQT